MRHDSVTRNRFNRKGAVVPDDRIPGETVGTTSYRKGDALFAPRHASPARIKFRAAHPGKTFRAKNKHANHVAAMAAVHGASA